MTTVPFRKILCPTDFSEPSGEALMLAIQLAEQSAAELLVVHVVPSIPPIPASPQGAATFNVPLYEQMLEQSSRKVLEELVRHKVPKELKVRPVSVQGIAADEILRIAADEEVDVIVIATHGRTGWQKLIFGSVAEKVIRLSRCPVLTVHPTNPLGE
jgi:nucleotide-binding universal stress UspA family protein